MAEHTWRNTKSDASLIISIDPDFAEYPIKLELTKMKFHSIVHLNRGSALEVAKVLRELADEVQKLELKEQ